MSPMVALVYAIWPFLVQSGWNSTTPGRNENVGPDANTQKQDDLGLIEKAVCLLPPKTGMCRGYMPMFYYDVAKGVCRGFVYGGCGGNPNRFKTLEKCQRFCEANGQRRPPTTKPAPEPTTNNPTGASGNDQGGRGRTPPTTKSLPEPTTSILTGAPGNDQARERTPGTTKPVPEPTTNILTGAPGDDQERKAKPDTTQLGPEPPRANIPNRSRKDDRAPHARPTRGTP